MHGAGPRARPVFQLEPLRRGPRDAHTSDAHWWGGAIPEVPPVPGGGVAIDHRVPAPRKPAQQQPENEDRRMTKPIALPALALAAVVAGAPAYAVDQAGAEALQSDFAAFLADLDQTYGLVVTPAAPVRVSVKDDSYQVDIAAFTLSSGDQVDRTYELHFGASRIRLTPDPDDSDLTAYAVLAAPELTLTVDGVEAAHLTYDSYSSQGVWSDALDTVISDVSKLEGVTFRFATSLINLPTVGELTETATLTMALTESETIAVPETGGLWVLRSRWYAEDMLLHGAEGPDGEPILIRSSAQMSSDMRLAGVPLAAWHDYILHWLPVLADAERSDTDLSRDQLIAMVTELPTFFSSATLTNTEIDSFNNGLGAAELVDNLDIRTNADGGLDIAISNVGNGLSFHWEASGDADAWDMMADALPMIADLMPNAYQSELRLDNVPVSQSWDAMVDTVDAWIDDPDAAAEVFFRTFADRAVAAGTGGTTSMTVDWPEAIFTLDATLAASRQAVLGVSGQINAAVGNMQYFTDTMANSTLPELAGGMIFLQALGQREEPTDGSPAVTRYDLEISEDGQVTFNDRDFGPVIRMVEEFFGAFSSMDMIPPQD